MTEPTILTERHGRVLLVTLNRPKALNALNSAVLAELLEVVSAAEADPGVGALGPIGYLAIAIPLGIVMGILVHLLVERPLLAVARTHLGRRQARRSGTDAAPA